MLGHDARVAGKQRNCTSGFLVGFQTSFQFGGALVALLYQAMIPQHIKGTDHVGKAIATYRLDKVEIAIDDWGKLSSSTLLATELPEVIEKLAPAAAAVTA